VPLSSISGGRSRATTATATAFAPPARREMATPVPTPLPAPRISASDLPEPVPNSGTARFQDAQPKTDVPREAPLAQPALAVPLVSGITDEQVAQIKQAIQSQQKFLGELVEHGTRWELDGAELRIYFSPDKRPFAEMLEGRDSLEKVRITSSKVLGRAVRVCAKLEAVAAAAASASRSGSATQELRAQFERDPMVKSMLQRFGGKIAEVKHRPEET
jgi:hypothetical protein